jgi:hypothetical protein
MKWYIGSRTAKKCHPEDGYICSSKRVKPMIKANPHEWEREILATGTREEMLEYEAELLDMFDASKDPRSFNLHNNNGKFNMTGRTLPPRSDRVKQKLSDAHKGKIPECAGWNKGVEMPEHLRKEASIRQTNRMSDPALREYMSEINMGDKNPNYGTSWTDDRRNKRKNTIEARKLENPDRYKHTDETKALISSKKKGQKLSDETRQKISVARTGVKIKGQPCSEEHKLKISIAMKSVPKNPESIEKRTATRTRNRALKLEAMQNNMGATDCK